MQEPQGLAFTIARGVAHIRLQRPECGNAIDAGVAHALLAAVLECARREDVRAVLLDSAGGSFCVGGDINKFAAGGAGLATTIEEIVTPLHAAIGVMTRMSAPVVAAVQGVAAGGGLGLALAADIALAGRSASFKTAYTAIGLSGDVGVTYMLPRLLGVRRARELFLTNRRVGAEEALALGMVDRVCEDAALSEEAWALARRLSDGPPLAHGAVKNLILDSGAASLEQQLAAEARWMVALARSADSQGAVRSFLEKQPPTFSGR